MSLHAFWLNDLVKGAGKKWDWYLVLLRWYAFKVFLPVAPSLLTMQVNVSGGCKALAHSLSTMEIQGIAFGLTGMLANQNTDASSYHFYKTKS